MIAKKIIYSFSSRVSVRKFSLLKIPNHISTAIANEISTNHPKRNIPQSIIDKLEKNLHKKVNHPIGIIKKK